MIDEGTLRERFPEIPWDQPVMVTTPATFSDGGWNIERWCCRYCIALHGLKGSEVAERGFISRDDCLFHIEREHHD